MSSDSRPADPTDGLPAGATDNLQAGASDGQSAHALRETLLAELTIANDLAMAGEVHRATDHFHRALRIDPDNSLLHDDLVYLLHFHPGFDDEAIFRELMKWERMHARPFRQQLKPHANDRGSNRRLRIGYVSPDFRRQAETFFVLPLLKSHDHQRFEIHCYSSVAQPDDMTEEIRRCADVWHEVRDLDDAALADRIRADGIDILVDLTMHMRMSRLLTFARKPAPVQVCWLAYPGGTGLRTMDYRLSDRFIDPPGLGEPYTEETWRLPDCWVCYTPCSNTALATPRTAGPISFGCLNHPRKLNDYNLRLYARMMSTVECSRILLHIRSEDHRRRALEIFAAEKISAERIEFLASQQRWEYLRTYDRIDIALDTLPYNGITTTCDALWMGTPVVNLIGRTAAARAGHGILVTAGLPELIARNEQEFMEIARRLAADRDRLIHYRRTLRGRLESSPIMNAPRFAANVEAAYRAMWQRWAMRAPPPPAEPVPPAAMEHHKSGRLREAEAIYTQILLRQPRNADVLGLMGMLAGQSGRGELSVKLLTRAVAVNDSNAPLLCNFGVALQNTGRLDEAIDAYEQAIAIDPRLAEAYNNLGNALRNRGDLNAAIDAFRHAADLKPDYAQAHANLGNALRESGDLDAAIASLRRSIEIDPRSAPALSNLGVALGDKGADSEAIQYFEKAIAVDPNHAAAHNNLGKALMLVDRFEPGLRHIQRAIELQPGSAMAHYNLGNALRELGRLDEAAAAYRRAIELDPQYADAHFNLGWTLLSQGNFSAGWPEHAWRVRAQPRFLVPVSTFVQRQWDGSDLNGRIILLHAEQGFGDTLQFIRYAPMVAARGGKIVFACQRPLIPLLSGFPGVDRIISVTDPIPEFDVHCPLVSLPMVFGTEMNSIPAGGSSGAAAYIAADQTIAERWREKMSPFAESIKIGIAWSGNPNFKHNHKRSTTLQAFAPLAGIDGVEFFSLQKGEAASQAPPAGMKLIDWTADLHDFADTAGLIENLDLVITVDTAVAHLAGAMGKPVWVLLHYLSDWRWLIGREDSPWYPSMRLFRQDQGRDWSPVMQRAAAALKAEPPATKARR